MHHYPHHISDFDHATRHLTRLERSVYRDLLDMYYDTEMAISTDLDYVCKRILATAQDERTAVEQCLKEFFFVGEQGFENARCEKVISDYRANKTKKVKAGKASGKARRLKIKENKGSTGVQQRSSDVGTKDEQNRTNQNQNQNHKPIVVIGASTTTTAMSLDWCLNIDTRKALIIQHGIPDGFIDKELTAFIRYWFDRGEEAESWDAKFIQSCQHQWDRHGGVWVDET